MRLAWKLPLAIALTAVLWLAPTARTGEPVGGASSTVCDPVCADPAVTVICKRTAFAWGGSCWNRKEGDAFAHWLRARGASPARFAQRHPELARIFGNHWPGVNWAALERSFPAAAAHAGQRFGVSASWLSSCAASEGGRTPGHIAIGAAGEVGWFQYLAGTWAFMSRSAFQTRGAPPSPYRRITSIVGQTWTTAWAFSRGLSYHWHGSGC